MNKDLEKFLRIARAINAGQSVSFEDTKYFNTFKNEKFDSAAYDKATESINKAYEEGKLPKGEDLDSLINGAQQRLTTDPAYRDHMVTLAKQAQAGKLSQETANGINTLLAGTDIMTSLNQINKGNQALSQLRQPARPPILAADQRLASALQDAQQGTFAEPNAIAAARLGNVDALASDNAAARTAAGGQAGAYGAYHQSAVDRYNRANTQLVPMADQIHAREQNRYDQLLGMKLGENQAINQSQSQFYPQDVYQYMQNRNAANSLISTGQSNLRGAMTGLASTIPNYAVQMSNRRYDDLRNQHAAYGDQYGDIAAHAQRQVDMMHGRQVPPDDQSQYEDAYMGVGGSYLK